MRRYLDGATDDRYIMDDREELEEARISGRSSDTKSIGSLSQHFFESDEEEKYFGTCNGYASQPGSKSNLLLCSECDQKSRTCTYRPQTPGSYSARYVEERFDDRATAQEPGTSRMYRSPVHSSPRSLYHEQDYSGQSSSPRSMYLEQDYRWPRKYEQGRDYEGGNAVRDDEDDDSPICELCHGNGQLAQCEHCDFSSDGDLICFRCQSEGSNGSNGGQSCPRCERMSRLGSQRGATSSSDEGKYPVDAVVKIQVNDRNIDVDSDDTADSDVSSSHHHQRSTVERLDTIVEAKGDTASENDEENGGTKINGTNSAKYLNYMIVLFL